ncbi:hypothetical protein B0H14DRAFT_2606630 [Mycena olivaceomarginata]|nr:hypothetical protein B0H14DRAFT_2606630 [Mycena olivaceomarginata]
MRVFHALYGSLRLDGPALIRVGRAADALYFTQRWFEADGVPRPGAALAAFTLDGDSVLARQYLHIAVQYPLVLIKLLGKFRECVDGDMHPDLWMQDDMWNWVDSDPTCKKKEEPAGEWQKCSGCKKVRELSTVASTARRLFLGMVTARVSAKRPIGQTTRQHARKSIIMRAAGGGLVESFTTDSGSDGSRNTVRGTDSAQFQLRRSMHLSSNRGVAMELDVKTSPPYFRNRQREKYLSEPTFKLF